MRQRLGLACAAALTGTALLTALAPTASAANQAPRVVRATVIDWNEDQAADAIELRYSERIRHARDADGRYPFRVEGFKIASIGATKGTQKLVIVLKPRLTSDLGKSPVVSYNRTTKQPVRDMKGKQAAKQSFRKTIALTAPTSTPTKKLVTVTVSGPGYVTSTPTDINCPPTCSALFDVGSIITLEAHASQTIERAEFAAWSGACSGSAPSCLLTLAVDLAADAAFVQRSEDEVREGEGMILPIPVPESPLPMTPVPPLGL